MSWLDLSNAPQWVAEQGKTYLVDLLVPSSSTIDDLSKLFAGWTVTSTHPGVVTGAYNSWQVLASPNTTVTLQSTPNAQLAGFYQWQSDPAAPSASPATTFPNPLNTTVVDYPPIETSTSLFKVGAVLGIVGFVGGFLYFLKPEGRRYIFHGA